MIHLHEAQEAADRALHAVISADVGPPPDNPSAICRVIILAPHSALVHEPEAGLTPAPDEGGT